MLPRCLSCYRIFPGNDAFARTPLGERIVFDPVLGRLWVVCSSCARWTLQPIEERWEVLEDLERAVHDEARLLARTDNIAMFSTGGVEIVRVGSAGRRERAWWRYGRELAARQDRARRVVRRGKVVDAAVMMMLTGIPTWALSNPDRWIDRARRGRFGRHAWRGDVACRRCGSRVSAIRFNETGGLTVALDDADETVLRYACRRCRGYAEGGYEIRGTAAIHVLRRVLAWRNFAGADESAVETAMSIVDRTPTMPALLATIPERRLLIGSDARLPRLQLGLPSATLPLEILLNADLERHQLTMELADLEARWREEERLACIIDRELT